jgi:hypothetical protein
MTHRNTKGGSTHPTFEPLSDLYSHLLFEGTFKEKEMDIDAGKTPTSATHQ